MISFSEHHLKIERVIRRYAGGPEAEFRTTDRWLLCRAWIKNGKPGFDPRSSIDSIELASAVSVAIRMAIDWVLEEQSK